MTAADTHTVDFSAANEEIQRLNCWRPRKADVDAAIPEKELTEARILDLGRNNGYMRGAAAVDRDTVVGSQFLLQMTPSADVVGPEHCDWMRSAENQFHEWADDPQCWIDARRSANFVDLMRLASTQLHQHGEAIFTREWRASPTGYRTCFFAVDPCRLDRSYLEPKKNVVGGVEVDSFGAPVAYHFTRSIDEKRDGLISAITDKPRRVRKFNRFGWQQVFHVFEHDRSEQTRGFSRLASAVIGVKSIDRYESLALDQASNAAKFGMYLKSDYGPEIFRAFGDDAGLGAIKGLLGAVKSWGEKTEVMHEGVKIPKLMPNDEIGTIKGDHPNQSHGDFVRSLLRKIAAGSGISYEQLAKDYEGISYSAARASLIEAWRSVTSKREGPISRLASLFFRAWMDEAIAREYVVIPDGITYWDRRNRAAITKCKWIGPGRGEHDPLKSARANEIYLRTGEKTLMDICAENGQRWEEQIAQRELERAKIISAREAAMGIKFTESEKRAMSTGAELIPPQSIEAPDERDE